MIVFATVVGRWISQGFLEILNVHLNIVQFSCTACHS